MAHSDDKPAIASAGAGTDPYHELPSFDLDQVQLQFGVANLKLLLVRNNIMYLVLDKAVYKINLDDPANVKQFQLPNTAEYSIADCWLSPNGHHFLCQTSNQNYFYLHHSYDKFKILPKFKGIHVKIVSFPFVTEQNESTGDFLVVTADDAIYIANIKSHDPLTQPNKKDDKYLKLLYKNPAISGIMALTFADSNHSINLFTASAHLQWDCFDYSYGELNKVLKATPKTVRKYEKSEAFQLASNKDTYAFIATETNSISSNDKELQLSETDSIDSFYKLSEKPHGAILTDHHIIALSNTHKQLYIFNKLSGAKPIELALESYVDRREKVIGIIADDIESTYWLYTRDSIYELIVTNESISVWYNYFKMGKYDEALKCLEGSQETNFFKKDMVLIKQGYDFLQRGALGIDYGDEEADADLVSLQIKGIKILGQASEPFEKVCLMLLNLQKASSDSPVSTTDLISEQLLVEYLLVKFNLAKEEKNRIRLIVLSSLIIELMLRVIFGIEREIDLEKSASTLNGSSGPQTIKKIKHSILVELKQKFYSFLNQNYKHFDSATVYQIITQLNFPDKLIYYADLNKDYEFILNYYIDIEEWHKALQTLIKMYSDDFQRYEEVIYKKSTILLINYPKETVDVWLRFDDLNYERLLSTVLLYNKNNFKISIFDNHSLQFLQKVIYNKGVKSKVINNYYLSILITYPVPEVVDRSENDPTVYIGKQILRFLKHTKIDQTGSSKYYDPGFILRLCLNYKHYQPAILILINDMKLFKQALKLSLDHDLVDLSIYILNKYDEYVVNGEEFKFDGSDEFDIFSRTDSKEDENKNIGKNKLEEESFTEGKKLWLMFAEYLIKNVCEGKSYTFLDEEDPDGDVLEINGNGSSQQKNNGHLIQNVTNEIVGSMGVETVAPISATKANKVLRYLLKASYSTKMNSMLVGLKDLLPLFPESIMVNDFKEEIIKSLNQYNNKINQLSIEMKESLNISRTLKHKINESNQQVTKGKIYTIIEPGESCRLCNKLLINKNFIAFPNCHHNFHKECLVKHYLMAKGDYRFKKVFANFKKNNSIANKQELDEIMLSECVLCNESNILSIDNNLIDPSKDFESISEWAL